MGQITELMTVLGSNIEFVVIGCAELAAAVALATTGIARKMKKEKKPDTKSAEQLFLYELGKSTDEGYMLVRRKDTMPVYAVGDLEQLLGVSLQQVQEDITLLRKKMKSDHAVKMLWKSYRTWDRKEPLYAEIQMENLQWIRVTVYDCKDEKHDLVCFIKTTGTHRRMEEYEKELEQAEEASQSKTSFLYQMSHEIRTPMNGIMGMLTLAQEKLDASHPAAQYLTRAEELSGHLLSLINDILDMSRIEAGKVELEEKAFSLRSLGNKLYDMFAKNLESRGINYEVNFEDMTIDYVIGDELRISQIIINFLSNAVKFTQEGEIIVTFRQMFLQDGNVDLKDGSVTLLQDGSENAFPKDAKITYDGDKVTVTAANEFEITFQVDKNVTTTSQDGSISLDITGIGAMRVQIGANEGQVLAIRIPEVSLDTLGLSDIDISTQEGAQRAIELSKQANAYISSVRSRIGAYENRLEHTQSSLGVTEENVTSAFSRIMDTDMAEEMTEYANQQVLNQAGISVLTQANQRPAEVLQLLQ